MDKEAVKPKEIAEQIDKWLETPLGRHYIATLQAKYKEMHDSAEKLTLDNADRSNHIVYAAGLKFAMDFFSNRSNALKGGVYDKQ